MLRGRGRQPVHGHWQCGRIRLRTVDGLPHRSLATQPSSDRGSAKAKANDFEFGATTAGPGPRAGEPRPKEVEPPSVGSSFLWSLRTIKKAIKQLSDTYADSQQLRHPTYDSWMDRFKAEMPYEDVQGYHLSHNNKRFAALKKLTDPDLMFWKILPQVAPLLYKGTVMEHIPTAEEELTVKDTYMPPWQRYRQARERILLLKRNWDAIPEDVKQTVKWDDWVFPAGRIDMFKYEGFNPNTLLWTDVINFCITEAPRTNAINKAELLAELVGEGIESHLTEPEIGGPEKDRKMEHPAAPFDMDAMLPLRDPRQIDALRRERAKQNIQYELDKRAVRRKIMQDKWNKEREEYFVELATQMGVTVEEAKKHYNKVLHKEGTYWGNFFNAPVEVPKDYKFWEGKLMSDPLKPAYDKVAQVEAQQEEVGNYRVDPDPPLELEPDPPEKPYKPDPPEVIAKVVAEIREEIAAKSRKVPDPYVNTWVDELMKRHAKLLELKKEREELMQQVLDSGNVDGYIQLSTKEAIHGGTFEMVGSSAEMQRIKKEKGHPGPFGKAVAWLMNQPYRLPTASFPRETWIPPFEQDPERYDLRAYPDPFEISTWRFRRTETGYLGRIADWFSMRNNGKQWWWMPGDQPGIRRFELWWQDYKEGDEFWTRVAPHVLRVSWFRRYAMEYFTGAEHRTIKDMKNLEDFALSQQEYAFKALQHLYPRERLDFDLYRRALKGELMKDVEVEKREEEETNELRWGGMNEFKEAVVDPSSGLISTPGWLMATSGTTKMNLREALEILGYSAQLKAGQLPPLDEAKERSAELDAANQAESAKIATGWRRVVRELLKDPLLEPKILEMHEVAGKPKTAAHSGKSPYLGGKAYAAYLAIERAHQGIALTPEDELFLNLVKENLAAEKAAAEGGEEGAAAEGGAEGGTAKPEAKPAAEGDGSSSNSGSGGGAGGAHEPKKEEGPKDDSSK